MEGEGLGLGVRGDSRPGGHAEAQGWGWAIGCVWRGGGLGPGCAWGFTPGGAC